MSEPGLVIAGAAIAIGFSIGLLALLGRPRPMGHVPEGDTDRDAEATP